MDGNIKVHTWSPSQSVVIKVVEIVKNFCQEHNLETAWNNFQIDYTFSSPGDTSFSVIDHFLYNQQFSSNVINAGVIHRGDNFSGHSPIFLELNLAVNPKKPTLEGQKYHQAELERSYQDWYR